jgi:hypothetical protein
MKKLLLLAFLLIAKITFAQQQDTIGLNTPLVNGAVVYERVFNAFQKSKPELFDNAQLWFIRHYKSADCIQIQNDYTGRIVGSGTEVISFKGPLGIDVPCNVGLTIQIDCKDGKYRSRIFNAWIEPQGQEKDKEKIVTTADDLMNFILVRKTVNPVSFNKNQAKKILQSLSVAVNNVIQSINESMNTNDDF